MAENLKKKPKKGILKNSSSFDIHDRQSVARKSKGGAKWDEMNIMATLHPPDKDYGHMKIDEPKTPYNFDGLEENEIDKLDAADLAERIRKSADDKPRALQSSEESEEEDDMTPEEKQAKKEFENKRKKHYNEFYAVKLARKLLEKDEEEEDEASSTSNSNTSSRQ